MPYSLMHNGIMREFDFYAPPGWEYWVGKAWEQRRIGLPLVIALHGGAEDPLLFQEDWFFPRVWNLGLDRNGEADFAYQSPQPTDPGYEMMVDAGFPSSLDYLPGLLPLTQASKGYRTYNNIDGQSPFRHRTGIADTKSKSWPDAENWDDFNPTVVIYRDSGMEHTNLMNPPTNRYLFEKDVWRFFERHPRVLR
jgi:hypothetical protein